MTIFYIHNPTKYKLQININVNIYNTIYAIYTTYAFLTLIIIETKNYINRKISNI